MVLVSVPTTWKINMLVPYAPLTFLKQIFSKWKQAISLYLLEPYDFIGVFIITLYIINNLLYNY